MGHLQVRSLLLVVVFGAAAMAACGADTMLPPPPLPDFQMDFPPLPQPADMPEVPPCLNSMAEACGAVYQDTSMVEPCCTAVKKLFKSDPKCICDAVSLTQKTVKEYGLNGTFDGLETFRLCQMPTTSCEPGKPGYNAAPSGRFIGAFKIMLLLPLFFVL